MTLLVGRPPGPTADATGALALGARLALAWHEPLVVCTVRAPTERGPEGSTESGEPDGSPVPEVEGVEVAAVEVVDRSVPGGLARAARSQGASAIVLGDAPRRPGTVGARLARAADVPVALAGSGPTTGPISRLTCAFGGARGSDAVLVRAHRLAERTGAGLRVASFAARRSSAIPPEVGLDAEAEVVEGWREQIVASQRAALHRLGLDPGIEVRAVSAPTVEEAVAELGWAHDDLLVLGASSAGAAARVLLGDPAAAILRAAPVPVVVVPLAAPAS